jgi:hypothetical protein
MAKGMSLVHIGGGTDPFTPFFGMQVYFTILGSLGQFTYAQGINNFGLIIGNNEVEVSSGAYIDYRNKLLKIAAGFATGINNCVSV